MKKYAILEGADYQRVSVSYSSSDPASDYISNISKPKAFCCGRGCESCVLR